jgi:hypothetical protein
VYVYTSSTYESFVIYIYIYIYIYTHTHTAYAVCIHFSMCFISNTIKMQETAIVFGMVHSATTVVVMLHKHYSTFCNSVNIIMNYMYANMSESNSMVFVNNSFTFFKLTYCI